MSGPKHLWSGDWENESRQPAAAQPPAQDQEPEVQAAVEAPVRGRYTRRQLVIALTAGVAAAAITVALVVTLAGPQTPNPHHKAPTAATAPGAPGQPQSSGGGSLSSPSPTCQQSPGGCARTTSVPTATGPSANWMGMQIVTSPSGVVVSTVKLGSPADAAGFEPGDQIQSVDGHIIGSVDELRSDTDGVKIGAPVTVDVMRSSVQLTFASIQMTQRPAIHP